MQGKIEFLISGMQAHKMEKIAINGKELYTKDADKALEAFFEISKVFSVILFVLFPLSVCRFVFVVVFVRLRGRVTSSSFICSPVRDKP